MTPESWMRNQVPLSSYIDSNNLSGRKIVSIEKPNWIVSLSGCHFANIIIIYYDFYIITIIISSGSSSYTSNSVLHQLPSHVLFSAYVSYPSGEELDYRLGATYINTCHGERSPQHSYIETYAMDCYGMITSVRHQEVGKAYGKICNSQFDLNIFRQTSASMSGNIWNGKKPVM